MNIILIIEPVSKHYLMKTLFGVIRITNFFCPLQMLAQESWKDADGKPEPGISPGERSVNVTLCEHPVHLSDPYNLKGEVCS